MSDTANRILKNTIVRVGGYALGAGLYFFVTILIARYLGTEGFGYYSFIMAFVGAFQLLVDMGVVKILIRDIAVDKIHYAEKLGVARTLLWTLSLIAMALIVLCANLLPLSSEVRQSTYLGGLAVIITFYGLGYSSVLRAFEEMEWDVLGFVLHKLLFIGLVAIVIHTDWGLRGVFLVMLGSNVFLYLYYFVLVRVLHGWSKLTLNFRAAWALLTESLPLGIAEILRRLTLQVDKLLLAALATPEAVGLFSAAYKFAEAITPFTFTLTLPLYPVFARLGQESPAKLFNAFEQSLKFLYIMGVPLAVVLFVFADRAVVLFFGEAYRESALVLMLLSPTVMLLFPISIYNYIFASLGRQRVYTWCVTASLGIKVLLDLLLIPFYGTLGAAIGSLVAEIVLLASGLLMLRQFGGGFASLWLMWRPLLSGLILGVVCWWVKDMRLASLVLGVFTGLVAYGSLLLLLQTLTREEIALLIGSVRLRFGSVVR